MGLTFLAVRDHQQLVQEFATPWTCWNRTGRFNSQSTQPRHHTVLFFLHHAMGRTRVPSWFYGILLLWQHHRDCQQCACDDEHFESVSGYNFVFPRQSLKFCRYVDSNPCHHIRCRNIRQLIPKRGFTWILSNKASTMSVTKALASAQMLVYFNPTMLQTPLPRGLLFK